MSPVDAAVIRRKLGHIADVLAALGPLGRLSLDEYRARLYERKAAERFVQEGIEAALDINALLHLETEVVDERIVRTCVREEDRLKCNRGHRREYIRR